MASSYTAAGGPRLREFLDGLPVKSRWLAGHHVVWTTGQQDRADGVGPEAESHCSAFVAAACLALDVYLLRPPNHSQELLASAQAEWLDGRDDFPGPGAAHWEALGMSGTAGVLQRAMDRANAGGLVLAAYAPPPPVPGPGPRTPGHIVILRPQSDPLDSRGPCVMSAGVSNFREVRMAQAFVNHPGAWPDNIGLFACISGLESDAGPQP